MLDALHLPFQDVMVEAMANAGRKFVAADMGLGKSRCAIKAAEKVRVERVLVTAPVIGLVSWPAEIAKWATDARVLAVSDPDMVPDAARLGSGQTYLLAPYSEIGRNPRKWVEALRRFNADAVVEDEAHFNKERLAARTQALYGFRTDLRDGIITRATSFVWPLSGTPAPNFTSELWTHLHALAPETILSPRTRRPMSEQEFRERFSTLRTSVYGQHVTGSVNTPVLRNMTAPFIHRVRKADVRSEYPPILWTAEPLPLTAAAAGDYLDIPDDIDDDGLLDWMRNAYPSGSSERKALGLAKVSGAIEWARNFLENSDRKLIIFGWHTEVIAAVHAALGPQFGSVMITGTTSTPQRTLAVNSFQNDPAVRVFNGQMLAAGTTITLTAASDVVFPEDDWTPGTLAQAAARADRLGQTRGVVARILYVPGSKDERVAHVRVKKMREFNLMFN